MSGAKYLEPGCRQPNCVAYKEDSTGSKTWKIYQGNRVWQGRAGDRFVQEMEWYSEDAAQSYLDRLGRVRGWKRV